MKKRTFGWIAGGAIVAGVAAYCIYKQFPKRNGGDEKDMEAGACDAAAAPAEEAAESAVVSDFEQLQQQAVESIRKNHADAAQQLGEVVDEVTSNSAEVREASDQVSRDLDELMK